MPSVLDQYRSQIDDLCRKHRVKRLELFGSAARGDFNDSTSDIDLLVLFDKGPSAPHGDYLAFLDDLEKLFKRKVDLIDINSANNPYFIAEALRHRISLYAA